MENEILNVLLRTDPFEMLEQGILEELCSRIETREYKPGSYVFKQGNQSLDCLFIIAAGLVEITVSNDRGVETVVALRRAYDFFSETVVLSQQRYPGSARAKEHLNCLLVKRKDLEQLIYNYPDFSGFFNALLAERMRLLYEEVLAEQPFDAYSSEESPLFMKRVSQVMSYPVITCKTEDQVTDAATVMSEKDISAIVVLDNERRPRGILTEKNLVKYLIARQSYPVSNCRVKKVMSSNLVQIGTKSFLSQALVAMIRSKTKHLVVMERSELVGIVTMADLIKTRSTGTLLLSQDIESQPDLKGLSLVGQEIDNILNALIAEKAGVREIFEVMSELHERLARRVIQLSEERMKLEGWGGPPVDYCWINMGSAARYEQTLRTDQDNAIIFEDVPKSELEEVDRYFAKLAEFITDGLFECGFEKCKGDVMATNPKWRRPLAAWISSVTEWTRSYDPEDTRILTILLDYRPIWGNMTLAERFRENIFNAFKESLTARHMLTKDDLQYKLPINFLGSFITEKRGDHKNEVNLKKSGTVHIVNCIRIFAIKNEISEPSTFGRLKQLTEMGVIPSENAEFYVAGFETLMMFRIRENMKKMKQGKKPDDYVDPYSLRKRERVILKDALSAVSRLQKIVNKEFSVPWLKHYV